MIDEFQEWKAKQEPFTPDSLFFETNYPTFKAMIEGMFKEIYKLNQDQKLLAHAVSEIIEELDD